MKTRKRDELYCSVRPSIVLQCDPEIDWDNLYLFRHWIIERYKIHTRKDIEALDPPWTNDPILDQFRFCNVFREYDRQSRYLISRVSNNPELSLEDKIVNSVMFRAWNNYKTFRAFGFPHPAEEIYSPELKEMTRSTYKELSALDPERKWWSNAYNQGGIKQAWRTPIGEGYSKNPTDDVEENIPLRPFHLGVAMGENHLADRILACNTQEDVLKELRLYPGLAGFMSYQVFVDMTYTREFPWSENEVTIAGPGALKGLELLFKTRDDATPEELIFWLRNNINENKLFDDKYISVYEDRCGLPHEHWDPNELFYDRKDYDRKMNVMAIENCLCEFSKYHKLKSSGSKTAHLGRVARKYQREDI